MHSILNSNAWPCESKRATRSINALRGRLDADTGRLSFVGYSGCAHVLAPNVTLRNPAGPTFALPEKLLRTRTNSNGTSVVMLPSIPARWTQVPFKPSLQTGEAGAAFAAPGPSLPQQKNDICCTCMYYTLLYHHGVEAKMDIGHPMTSPSITAMQIMACRWCDAATFETVDQRDHLRVMRADLVFNTWGAQPQLLPGIAWLSAISLVMPVYIFADLLKVLAAPRCAWHPKAPAAAGQLARTSHSTSTQDSQDT